MPLHSLIEVGESSSSTQALNNVFPICSNRLLRIGLETVLAGGSSIIWPETIDDLSALPGYFR